MPGRWTLDDIEWRGFDAAKVDADILKIVKAAALVEFNGHDYADYLCNVFDGDAAFQQAARDWALEEVQHGEALARWVRLADPGWDFDRAVKQFRDGYRIDTTADASVRGTRAGELVARCMVETGTSSYYSALAAASDEPVLKSICQRIAADELRHYKLFYDHMKRYLEGDGLGRFKRLRIALSRIAETEDDELAYAWHAGNFEPGPYDRKKCANAYMSRAFRFYRYDHVDRVVRMVFKACGYKPENLVFKLARSAAWAIFRLKGARPRAAAV